MAVSLCTIVYFTAFLPPFSSSSIGMIRVLLRSRRRNDNLGVPKRLLILKKSKHMRRWLVKNPWVRPMIVFNYTAILIQKLFRGFAVRKKYRSSSVVQKRSQNMKTSQRNNKKKQLDRYLSHLEHYRRNAIKPPTWLGEGYSSWCAVRIQSFFRMHRMYHRYSKYRRLVSQVAVIILQTAVRNWLFKRVSNDPSTRPVATRIWTAFNAVQCIQLCWRSHCNRRIYRYFRDLVLIKLKGIPHDLLKSIIPNEVHHLDKAAGVHVRFRLGGSIFPPKVYFKIFTHRPLCDVNAFAPRDYCNERPIDPFLTDGNTSTKRRHVPYQLKVGVKYFDTVVATTDSAGTSNWYKREESNSWRSIASQIFEPISVPPWCKEFSLSTNRKPQHFHYKLLRRQEDLVLLRKRRKREWMMKAYHLANGFGRTDHQLKSHNSNETLSSLLADHKKPRDYASDAKEGEDNNNIYSSSSYGAKLIGDRRYADSSDRSIGSYDDSKDSESSNDLILMIPQKKIIFPHIANHSHGASMHGPHDEGSVLQKKVASEYEFMHEGRHPRPVREKDDVADLVDWSLALNFDDYVDDWSKLGISLPSEMKDSTIYSVAAEQSKHEKHRLYSSSKK